MLKMHIRSVPKEIKDMLISIAKTEGLSYRVVEDIYYHQFEFLANMMASGKQGEYSSYENILLKELGSFIANEKHINKLDEIKHANKEKDTEICE